MIPGSEGETELFCDSWCFLEKGSAKGADWACRVLVGLLGESIGLVGFKGFCGRMGRKRGPGSAGSVGGDPHPSRPPSCPPVGAYPHPTYSLP